jgi:uncharacterized protein YehS (DUF1456 family)
VLRGCDASLIAVPTDVSVRCEGAHGYYSARVTHNDVLRSLRYLLNVGDAKLGDIIRLGGGEVSQADLVAFLKRDDEEGYRECGHDLMARCLNGLVIYKRGRDESRPPQPVEVPVTNNAVLKKLRVAFELKDSDIISLIDKSGLHVSKGELGAFCRRPDHRNYRDCGDQFLRNLLKGLSANPLERSPKKKETRP